MEVEAPERWKRLQPTLPVLRFDAAWEGFPKMPEVTPDQPKAAPLEETGLENLQRSSVVYRGTLEYTLALLEDAGLATFKYQGIQGVWLHAACLL